MRLILLRTVLSLLLAAGILLGIGLPRALDRLPGYEIGRWPAYDSASGYMSIEPMFAPPEAPYFFTLAMTTAAPLRSVSQRLVLELAVVASDGTTVLRHAFGFPNAPSRVSPQSELFVYEETVVRTEPLDGPHAIRISAGPQAEPSIRSIELVLNAGAYDLDPWVQPLGFILLVLGGAGLLVSFRRTDEPGEEAVRWGRSGRKKP